MPMVYIQMHEGKDAAYKKAVSDGIHAAMLDVLGVPDDTWDQSSTSTSPATWSTTATISASRAART